jgi:hypothetical protein
MIRWVVVLAALAFVAGAVMVAGVAKAPPRAGAATTPALGGPPPGAPLDHFVCYHVVGSTNQGVPPGATIHESDEFTLNAASQVVPKLVHVLQPVKLCTPISKWHVVGNSLFVYPVMHPSLHLVCFKATQGTPTPPFTVSTDNQFNNAGDKRILTTQTVTATSKQTMLSLCLPSHKSLTPANLGGEPLDVLNHFACYKATETEPAGSTVPGLPAGVFAQDQFTPAPIPKTTVVAPTEVCNPATKYVTTTAGTQTFAPPNPDLHLVCFSIRSTVQPATQVYVDDQFTPDPAAAAATLQLKGPAYQLCAPSLKQIIQPPPG